MLIWQAINSFCFKLHSSIHPSLVVGAADLSILILILQSMHIILKLTKHQITNGRHAYALLNTFTKMALVTNTLIQCYAPKKQKISMLGNRFMQNNLIRIIWMCTKKVINKNVPSVFFWKYDFTCQTLQYYVNVRVHTFTISKYVCNVCITYTGTLQQLRLFLFSFYCIRTLFPHAMGRLW